jgi:hypothetical protein
MKQKSNSKKTKSGEPVLDFISGKTNTSAAKKLTKSIGSLQSLWQLAKMTGIVMKCSEE